MLIMQEIINMFMKRISSDAIIIWYRQALHTPSIMHIKKNVMALSQNEPSKEHFPYLYTVYINYTT